MKLQNIAIGSDSLVYRNTTQTYTTDTSKQFTVGDSYTKNHLLPFGSDEWNDDDVDLDTPHITGELKGIAFGYNTLTLTPKETNVFNPGTNNGLTQSGTYVGRAFNNFIFPNSSTYTSYVWGFETYIKLTASPASDRNVISYGYTGEVGTSAPTGYSRYQITINSSRQLCLTYSGRNSSTGKWGSTTINTATSSHNGKAIGYTSAMTVNAWYHLCLVRLGDGNVYHGYNKSMMTLVYLQPISNIDTYNTHYLNRISYNKSTSTWTFPTNSVSGTTNSFDNSVLNYNNTNFVCSGGATSDGWFGRITGDAEQTTAINLFKICDSGVNMCGGIYLKGGAYYQSDMTINMDKTITNNIYSKPTVALNNSNAFTTTYQYKKSM